jgi:hypothetical protein
MAARLDQLAWFHVQRLDKMQGASCFSRVDVRLFLEFAWQYETHCSSIHALHTKVRISASWQFNSESRDHPHSRVDHGSSGRYVAKHDGVGAYLCSFSDYYGTDYAGARADKDIVFDYRGSGPCTTTDHHVWRHDNVVAQYSLAMHHDAEPLIAESNVTTYSRRRRKHNREKDAIEYFQHPRQAWNMASVK